MASPTEVDDEALIDDIRAGRSEAFAELYRRHHAAARGYARSLLRSDQDADDAVAEAFTSILAALRNEAGPRDGFRAYLLASVRNHCARRFRHDARRHAASDGGHLARQLMSHTGAEGAVPERVVERQLVTAAFARLHPRWRTVLWMTEVEQREAADVAARTGLDTAGVAAALYRAREGFAESYLAQHLHRTPTESCARYAPKLARYVRGTAGDMTRRQLDAHLARCADCTAAVRDLEEVNHALRGQLAPALLVASAMSGGGATLGFTAAAGTAALGWFTKAALVAAAAIAMPVALTADTDRAASASSGRNRAAAAEAGADGSRLAGSFGTADGGATVAGSGANGDGWSDDPAGSDRDAAVADVGTRAAGTLPPGAAAPGAVLAGQAGAAVPGPSTGVGPGAAGEPSAPSGPATPGLPVTGTTFPLPQVPTSVASSLPLPAWLPPAATSLPADVTVAVQPTGVAVGAAAEIGPLAVDASVQVTVPTGTLPTLGVPDLGLPDLGLPGVPVPTTTGATGATTATTTTTMPTSTPSTTVCLPTILFLTLCG